MEYDITRDPVFALIKAEDPKAAEEAMAILTGYDKEKIGPLIRALSDIGNPCSVKILGSALYIEWRSFESSRDGGMPDNYPVARMATNSLVNLIKQHGIKPVLTALQLQDEVLLSHEQVVAYKGRYTVNPEHGGFRLKLLHFLSRFGICFFDPLRQALADTDANIRKSAAEALEQVGVPTQVEKDATQKSDIRIPIRDTILYALGGVEDKQAAELLSSVAQNPEEQAAWNAKAIKVLKQFSKDESFARASLFKREVIYILASHGDEEVVSNLIQKIESAPSQLPGLIPSYHEAEFVRLISQERFVEPLIRCLSKVKVDSEKWASRPTSLELISSALGKSGDKRAVQPLIESFNQGNPHAAPALADLKTPNAFKLLMQSLSAQNEEVRVTAISALGRLGDKRAVEALFRISQEGKDCDTRRAAILALAKLGDQRILEPLRQTLLSVLSDGNLGERDTFLPAYQRLLTAKIHSNIKQAENAQTATASNKTTKKWWQFGK